MVVVVHGDPKREVVKLPKSNNNTVCYVAGFPERKSLAKFNWVVFPEQKQYGGVRTSAGREKLQEKPLKLDEN